MGFVVYLWTHKADLKRNKYIQVRIFGISARALLKSIRIPNKILRILAVIYVRDRQTDQRDNTDVKTSKFFTSVLTGCCFFFSEVWVTANLLKFSGLLKSFQQCWGLDGFDSSRLFLRSLFQAFMNHSKWINYSWCCRHFHVSQLFRLFDNI